MAIRLMDAALALASALDVKCVLGTCLGDDSQLLVITFSWVPLGGFQDCNHRVQEITEKNFCIILLTKV